MGLLQQMRHFETKHIRSVWASILPFLSVFAVAVRFQADSDWVNAQADRSLPRLHKSSQGGSNIGSLLHFCATF